MEGNSTVKENYWVGASIQEIYGNVGPWQYHVSPVAASKYHSVLYQLPAVHGQSPKPHYGKQCDWDDDHVRMPYSPKNLFPSKDENDEDILKSRWELIQTSLLRPFSSSKELEAAINRYNTRCPPFLALHYFFEEELDEDESEHFFKKVLPGIINLALQLPDIVPCSIPLLKQGFSRSLSLSQLQVACLLANAFLCTFPWRRDSAATYPGINFVRLYAAHGRPNRQHSVCEKLKCICHYFRRVLDKTPTGVITFERKHVYKSDVPRWDQLQNNLSATKVHITSRGTIENDGTGMLQVDFANKYLGGGVIGAGCVQEEIRFVICPELIVTRLFVEQLGDNEALLCLGAERYSDYLGYGDTFTWSGNYNDKTPSDSSCRRKTSVIAIDATHYSKPTFQYNSSAMLRELTKAYAGYLSRNAPPLSPVATGNWGCGAYRGDVKLKFLIQLMACNAAGRDMVYFTFEDGVLRDTLYNMYQFLSDNQLSIAQLWKYLCQFAKSLNPPQQLYSYIQQTHFDSKKQPSIKSFFSMNRGTTSSASNKEAVDTCEKMEIEGFSSDEEEFKSRVANKTIPPLKTEEEKGNKLNLPNNHDEIASVIKILDGNIETSVRDSSEDDGSNKLSLKNCKRAEVVITVDEKRDCGNEILTKSDESNQTVSKIARMSFNKSRITDYFCKTDKPK